MTHPIRRKSLHWRGTLSPSKFFKPNPGEVWMFHITKSWAVWLITETSEDIYGVILGSSLDTRGHNQGGKTHVFHSKDKKYWTRLDLS